MLRRSTGGTVFAHIENYGWNHIRVHRIYKELEFNIRIRPRRRIKPDALNIPTEINQAWSIDFMSDSLMVHDQAMPWYVRFLK